MVRVATTTSWSTNTMINTAMTNTETKMSSTVPASMESKARTKTLQTSITNRMIRSIGWTIKPALTLKTLTQFRIDKNLACSTIATSKCNIILKAGPIKDKCHLINPTLVMKKRFTTQSLRKSWSNFSTNCKPEKIALMAQNLTPREEMAQLEGKPGNWFQMSHLLGLTSWESSWKSNTFVNLKMTKSTKCTTIQMNTANTSCSIQLLTSISMKSLKEECAPKSSRPPEWKIWASSLSTSALPIALLESALILLQPPKELAAMTSTQMVDRWLTSTPLKQPNSTTLKSTRCSALRTIQLKLNKACEMSRIVPTSTSKMRISNSDTALKRISTSKLRSGTLMFLAWNLKWSKTSTKTIFVLQVSIKVHEQSNDEFDLKLYTMKYQEIFF